MGNEVEVITNADMYPSGTVISLSGTVDGHNDGLYIVAGRRDEMTITLKALTGWRLVLERVKVRLIRGKWATQQLWWKLKYAYWDLLSSIESRWRGDWE